MPTVGGTKFPYTKKGIQEAKAWSEITGKPLKMESKPTPKVKPKPTVFKEKAIHDQPVEDRVKQLKKKHSKPAPLTKGQKILKAIESIPTIGPTIKIAKHLKKSYDEGTPIFAQGGLASMGRRGDTAIRPVAGRPSHVNPIEAGMIDMLGPAVGSQFAKATTDVPGSRNPKTGLPEYSWLSKRFKPSKKAKKWWNKHVKRGIVNTGIQAGLGNADAMGRWTKRVHGTGGEGAYVRGYRDPNLFGARQRFSSGSDISSLMKNLQSGKGQDLGIMEQGGEVPAGRRMYGMGKKKKSLQTVDIGPVRGYAKGGKAGYHT